MRRRLGALGALLVLLLGVSIVSGQQLTYPAIPGMSRLGVQLVRLVSIPFPGAAPQSIEVITQYSSESVYSALVLDGGVNVTGVLSRCVGCGSPPILTLGTEGASSIVFQTNNVARWRVVNTLGHFAPDATSDNTYDIGISGGRARVVRAGNGIYLGSEPGSTVAGMMFFSGVAFAALGTPTNGHMVFCSDCTVANPCAAAGTGALAKRLNGAWVCN